MYRIVGNDNREYGPTSAANLRQWVAEGRANGQSMVSFENDPWKMLATFPEFHDLFSGLGGIPPRLSSVPPLGSDSIRTRRANGCAVGGFICACVGLLPCCCSPFAIAGLAFSVAGYYQIQHEPHRYSTSQSLAFAGIIISILGLLLSAGYGVLMFVG